jgi:hypothetical protein
VLQTACEHTRQESVILGLTKGKPLFATVVTLAQINFQITSSSLETTTIDHV